jgi:tellurite resistance protein TerC
MSIDLATVGTPVLWVGFTAFVLAMLTLDLFVFHRHVHEIRIREALVSSVVWISLALAFNAVVYVGFGSERALEFLTGYLIEKALSVDNLFVFLVIFSYFRVPSALQHRVLFWGILGALALRALFIVTGAALLQRFHWVMYVFGAFLVFTAVRLIAHRDEEIHPERNAILRLFRRLVRSVPDYRGTRLVVAEAGRWFATPLLTVLVVVEATDIVFAVDSIPAVFAVTSDPFIVYTSNIFAILGLRALYFLLAGMMSRFHYLKVGLGLVLGFVGAKMLIADLYELPIGLSLAVVALLLAGSVILSILRSPAPPPDESRLE